MDGFGDYRAVLRRIGLGALWIVGLLSIVATGGGGSDAPPVSAAPTLSVLTLSNDTVPFRAGDGRTTIEVTVRYTDPQADITTLRVEVSDGSSLTVPVSGPLPDTSGELVEEIEFSTEVAGTYTVEVWAVDAAGNNSNHLTTTLAVQGSSDLSSLTLSEGTLDPLFDAGQTIYTALVDFAVASITVTATPLEPAASLTIDGMAATSGSESAPIALVTGDNAIVVEVTSSDGVRQTYTITVQRPANPLLSDLSVSGGAFDQIFQPTQMDYTATFAPLQSTTTIVAVPVDAAATITMNGASISAGTESPPIALAEGENLISVIVTGSDGVTTANYSIAVSRESIDAFAQRAYIKASNTDTFDTFGWAVALSGETLAVGAPGEDSAATGIDGDQGNNDANQAGSVYIFVRDAAGLWSQQAYIKASNADAGDHFGRAVAIAGDTLVVAAPDEDSAATGIDGNQSDNSAASAGAVYVFERDEAGAWTQQAYIKASNTDATSLLENDLFGTSIALSGNTIAVGASGEDSAATGIGGDQSDNSADGSGAVYMFVRDPAGAWAQQAYIKASNADGVDGFGRTLALSGDRLAVGAPFEDSAATGIDGDQSDNSVAGAGAVYVFGRDATGAWAQEAYVKASNTETSDPIAGDLFGRSVALSGDLLAVGALDEDSAATGVDGDQNDNSAFDAGAVYVFARDGDGLWAQEAYIKASNTDAEDLFGVSLALSGNTLVVGAPDEDSAATGINGDQSDNSLSGAGAGAVYLFMRDTMQSWAQRAYIKPSNTHENIGFGQAVALDADTLVVGANSEASAATGIDGDQSDQSVTGAGAVYTFR